MRPFFPLLALVLLVTGSVRAAVDLRRENPKTAGECDALVAAHPQDFEAYRCFLLVARRDQQWSDAVRSLEALLAVDPDNQRARMYLGWIEADRFRPRAVDLLRGAAEGFARTGDALGEARARLTLAYVLSMKSELEAAETETEIASLAADTSGDRETMANVALQRGWNAYNRADFSSAWDRFAELNDDLRDDDTAFLHARVATALGSTAWATGRLPQAFEHYSRAADMHLAIEDRYAEASDRYNMALLAGQLVWQGELSRKEARDLTAQAVEAARVGGNPGAEASARLLVAQDPGLDPQARVRETELALRLAREGGNASTTAFATRLLATNLRGEDLVSNTDRALELMGEAIELARRMGSLPDLARGYVVRAGMGVDVRPRADTLADYLAAIKAIELMRDLQRDELIRARFLWNWVFVYHRTAGFLLQSTPTPDEVATAFSIVERLRARILLDVMDSAGATPAMTPNDPHQESRLGVLERIAELRRMLAAPGVTEEESEELLNEMARLETEEADLRARLARAEPSYALLRDRTEPEAADVQAALAPDQAMIAMHLSTREINDRKWYWQGGSWAFVITPDTVETVPLPERDVLEEKVAVFLGLLERRDKTEVEAAARLYEDLLEEALGALPSGTRRLVLVPDGVLHRLPFSALRHDPDGEVLAERYEISSVPSAGLWLHLKRSGRQSDPRSALALADPETTAAGLPGGAVRSASSVDTTQARLPRAREEARGVAREISGSGRVLAGSDANESFLKSADLRRFGVLHFAVHALIDEQNPRRSGILLAPGAEAEDGLVQMGEVGALELDGPLVILSACSSLSGEITKGEGVVGLARAFFQAGARTVVGSLWPLRDAEAARLVVAMARHLGQGMSVGAALTAARRELVRAGEPAAAWAGLVVLGDAEFVPLPGGRRATSTGFALWIAPASLLLLAALILSPRFLRVRNT